MRPPFVDRNFGRPGVAILLADSVAQFGGAYVAWIVRNWRVRLELGFAFYWESGEIAGFAVRGDSGSLTPAEITDVGQLSLVRRLWAFEIQWGN